MVNDPVPSGRELARLFHDDVVAPWLARAMPGLRYAAGRLGSGSDVLGLGITDPQVARLPAGIGSIEQWASNVDLLAHPERRRALRTICQTWAGPG